jgi:hypothetical protein
MQRNARSGTLDELPGAHIPPIFRPSPPRLRIGLEGADIPAGLFPSRGRDERATAAEITTT